MTTSSTNSLPSLSGVDAEGADLIGLLFLARILEGEGRKPGLPLGARDSGKLADLGVFHGCAPASIADLGKVLERLLFVAMIKTLAR